MKEDWIECQLGEVCDFIGGGTPSKSNSEYWNGTIPWASIKDIKGDFLEKTEDFITEIGLKQSASNLALENEIILATRINPGKPIISKIKTAINQDLKIVKHVKEIDTNFLFYSLKNLEKKVVKLSSGTTVLGINLNNLNTLSTPLAPLPIQRAIVSKIEALFSDLDIGIAHFKKAQAQLKIYRQAVLKKAFEGRFTNEKVEEGELPKGWKWVKLGDVCQKIQIGPFGSQLHEYDYISNNIPLINPTHIKNGKVVPDVNLTISSEKMTELPNYILEEGDVIMGRRGEMGRCALITIKENGWFCGTGSLYFRPNQKRILPKYLSILLGSQMIKSELINQSKGTTMTNLNKKIVSELLIPLSPSLAEQSQIVAEIESRLSVCDKVEQSLIESLEKAEALRQSILKKAFEGKLLTAAEIAQCRREADYAPASELLRRIEQRRNEQKSAGKTAKTKKK